MSKWCFSCCFLSLMLLLWPINASAQLAPFTTDGCSLFPDGTLQEEHLWRECCVAHDRAYWKGGSYKQRAEADKILRTCVARVSGHKKLALLMLIGVRIGGSPLWPTPFRWGFGWPYPRSYAEHTPQELELIDRTENEHTSKR